MAKAQKKTLQNKPKTNNFLSCFGCSNNNNIVLEYKKETNIKSDGMKKKKKARWSFWTIFSMKKSATRTVPLEFDNKSSNSNSKFSSNSISNFNPQSAVPHDKEVPNPSNKEIQVLPHHHYQLIHEDQIQTSHEPNNNISEQNNINSKLEHVHVDASKDDTHKKQSSFCRKIEAIRTGSTHQSGSPPDPNKSKLNSEFKLKSKLIKSTGVGPTCRNERRAPPPSTYTRQNDALLIIAQKKKKKKQLDPVLVGLSIIMVTLLVMLLWGRFCAILCTSSWCYFVPCFKTRNLSSQYQYNRYDSEEYRKKVILEGFLERTH
ncbi:uncharacterized protein LOC142629780 [Castanea sativa]|uniref:uncharacterized protein LOC142629780 n=1 Tax=Castanea sativa TaxID=21020 RepID=UPI003F64D9C2